MFEIASARVHAYTIRTYIGVTHQRMIDIAHAREPVSKAFRPETIYHEKEHVLVDFGIMSKHDNGNFSAAKDAQLVRFLEQTSLSLSKCD